jgi:hypothetical protein
LTAGRDWRAIEVDVYGEASMGRFFALALLLGFGCGGGNGGGTASVTTQILKGPSPVEAAAAARAPSGLAPGHRLFVSPDQVTAAVTGLILTYNEGGPDGGILNSQFAQDCTVTYDADDPALTTLAECSMDVPEGAIDSIYLSIDWSGYQILIDDPANGVFTDPATGNLSATEPAGGAQLIPHPTSAGSVNYVFLKSAVEISAADPPTFQVITHATHTMTVDGNNRQFLGEGPPMLFIPAAAPVTTTTFYSSTNVGRNVDVDWNVPGGASPTELFFMGDAEGYQVVYINNAASPIQSCLTGPNNAFAIDPDESRVGNDGSRSGGWLGKDGDGSICFALGTIDNTWSSSTALWEVPEITTAGGMATVTCEATTTAPPPTTGDTYASGCPTITPVGSSTVYLVAE